MGVRGGMARSGGIAWIARGELEPELISSAITEPYRLYEPDTNPLYRVSYWISFTFRPPKNHRRALTTAAV
jgi:hypothetical protein